MSGQEKNIQQNPEWLPLIADQQAMHIEFIDLVQSSANPEIVVLNFIQRFPESTPLPGHQPQEGAIGRLVARFAFTWPHIERIRDLLDRLLTQRENSQIASEGGK
ncbi:hypothetical protein E308F_09000 [Moorella sp. E308F]|uniref:Uncharacterized protein n=1 Tax=Neomoorella thermoacetica TaxID=1525 RepID=A0A1J5JEY6_NEOTH|nr:MULTISPECIES: hypothetical protein [Moorella]OIQ08094.1 hypothetical protein MOOR_22700 [Moorella thermoacetica]GEA14658.1 hypothetical protein E308F_09000 [Moorella sp. E308F]